VSDDSFEEKFEDVAKFIPQADVCQLVAVALGIGKPECTWCGSACYCSVLLERSEHHDVQCLSVYMNKRLVGLVSFGCSRINHKCAGYGKAPVTRQRRAYTQKIRNMPTFRAWHHGTNIAPPRLAICNSGAGHREVI